MKKTILIGLALICTTVAGLLWLYLSMVGRSYTVASNSMLPLLGPKEIVFCTKDDIAKLTYGDLVIYRTSYKKANGTIYFKMIAGLAGDTVQMRDGVLWINGSAIPKRRDGDFELRSESGGVKKVPRFEETLPGGRKISVLDIEPAGRLDNTDLLTVPEGHVFVIGNNRDHSMDSRTTKDHGPVSVGDILCKAEV